MGFATVAIDERGYRRGALNERVLVPLSERAPARGPAR
jgi:hypothetical protein